MENNSIDNMRIGDYTIAQWEERMNNNPIPSSMSYQEAQELGVMQADEEQVPQSVEPQEKEYEKLSVGESLLDAAKAVGVEASHFVMPKAWEKEYESRTKLAENLKYLYRYGVGTIGFIYGGEVVAGLKLLANAGQIGKGVQTVGKLFSGADLIKTGAKATKAAQIGARIGNASLGGALAGAAADYTLYRPEENEGHFADIFGETDNAFIDFMQSKETDTDFDAKLKNVVEGFVMGIGMGNVVEFGLKPLLKNTFKSIKALKDGKEGAIEELASNQAKLERFANKYDLKEKVKEIKAQADANGEDASQILIDTLHPDDNIEAQKMLKIFEEGEDVFIHSDGTWDISVSRWDKAAQVTPEEYRKQLAARDLAGETFEGDTAIKHQDEAVKETWTNRGWVGENEELNQKAANKIANNYKDKWQIDNKVKVEFVDGLTINGKQVEGNTTATKYQGKTKKPTKAAQTKIDKKKQEIRRLQDKITQLEGGNAEVHDELDLLKEDLRIKNAELKALENIPKAEKIPDITIQIDVNAKNPYATLRAELEHARDIAKGEVPNQKEKHFSRYEGMNEGEVASGYVYKKAQGKAKALNQTSQNVMNDGNIIEEGINYKGTYIESWINNIKAGKVVPTTVGDILSHVGFLQKFNYILKDVKDTPIRILSDSDINDAPSGLIRTGKTTWSNDDKCPIILINPNRDVEQIEYTLYHEIKHVEQFKKYIKQAQQGNPTELNNFINHYAEQSKLRAEGKFDEAEELYNNSKYEKEANNHREMLLKLKEEYDEQQLNTGTDKRNQNGSAGARVLADETGASTEVHGRWNEQRGSISSSNREDAGMGTASTQLKLDFTSRVESKQSTQEITNSLINGEITPTTKGDIETILTKTEQLEPEISGFKFDNVKNDAEAFATKLEELFDGEDISGLIDAYTRGDIDTIERAVRKQMAAATNIKNIEDNLAGKEVSIETKVAVVQVIKHLGDYIKGVKSGYSRGLNSQKSVNQLLESYGASRLSSWTKEGIDVWTSSIIDKINEIISLNFTRGKQINLTQELFRIGLEAQDTRELTRFIMDNKDMSDYFSTMVEKLSKENRAITKEDLNKIIVETLTVPEYNAIFQATRLAKDENTILKTIKNWCDGRNITSYYVHNLLSGVGSLAKNVGSGIANTIYFPARKLLASTDLTLSPEARTELWNEGWRTYKNLLTGIKESALLMKEAFIKGNGKLTDIGENTLNMDDGQFRGFHEFKIHDIEHYQKHPNEIWKLVQNFHSIMTRAMGATDEFMSQLNYRAIARSKALAEAERYAQRVGRANDEDWINKQATEYFNDKFDLNGKPTDVEALNEARTILYQSNLDGTMYNYKTGAKKQMREQTWLMQMASSVQTHANKNWFVKCIFPFVKTGANILQMSLDHNGIYMALSPANQKVLFSRTKEGALARSQVAFGCFSLIIGSMMAMNGKITGSPPSDKEERKALFASGWKPYSIKTDTGYISYQGYEPLHTILGFAADVTNMYSTLTNEEDEERVKHFQAQIMPTLVNNFLDKAAFRTGLNQLSLILDPTEEEKAKKALAQQVKGFLPNVAMVTNTKSVGEHDVMQPRTLYERVFYRYFPENWTPMDYRRNVFGEVQSITGYLATTKSGLDDTPEGEALTYLAQLGYSPEEIDDTIKNMGLKISDFKNAETGRSAMDAMKEEMSTLTIQGLTLREAIRELVTSEEYQTLPDGVDLETGARWGSKYDTKINAVNDIFLMYKQRAKRNVMENSENFVDSNGNTMDEAQDNVQLKRLQQLTNLY